MSVFYNDNDLFVCDWLRNLIANGRLPAGVVDDTSIADLDRRKLAGVRQVHFFAGIGVWPAALRAAGWPDRQRVWTGSCPCQPFSAAGKGGGFADDRHLWPAWFRHIRQHRPDTIFGEQVEGPAGRAWLDLVFADLEGIGYACGAAVFPAAGVGAPHARHRIVFVADAAGARRRTWLGEQGIPKYARDKKRDRPSDDGAIGGLADAAGARSQGGRSGVGPRPGRQGAAAERSGAASGPADAKREPIRQQLESERGTAAEEPQFRGSEITMRSLGSGSVGRPGPVNGVWRDADWIFCRDGLWRPVEPGSFPLAHGAPARVGRLRAYGNAVVLQAAQVFVEAFLEHEALSL